MASKSIRNRQRRKRKEALLAAPDVAVTVAVSAPDKEKKMGGGIMVPPEREEMAEGGIGDLLPETETYLKNKKILDDPSSSDKEKAFAKMQIEGLEDAPMRAEIMQQVQRILQAQESQKERTQKAEGGKFPDLTGDGKVTQADILKGRDVFQEGGMPVDTYPNIPPEEMAAVEASQLPDDQMEDKYIDYVLNEALQPEEQTYLMNTLENDPQLSMIFDKVVGTASEFTGSGEVAGPGTGVSDSIPARLSDGEFVMTRKATDQIGADRLQRMMDEAERAYDGGLMRKDEDTDLEDDMNKVMMSSNQMPSLNVRQR